LPFAKVGLGMPEKDEGKTLSFTRIPWLNPDPRVILYSLYRFSEECGSYKQFTLTRLLNHEIESDGVSPTQIFGLDRKTMERILKGLENNYPDFITVSFALDLDNINLKDKTSKDVLTLFEEE
jgi:phosphoadenosine phosphosulfate reductase